MRSTLFKKLFLLVLFIPSMSFGQSNENKYEVKLGYGIYQGFNLGINYFYRENLSIGIGFGSHFKLPPFETEKHFNILVENCLQFGRIDKQGIKSRYFNQQLMYWERGASSDRWRIVSLGLNIGREFAISKNLGIAFEIGPAFNLFVDVKRDPLVEPSGFMLPILCNGRVQIVYLF